MKNYLEEDKMKKIISMAVVLVLLAAMLAGCGGSQSAAETTAAAGDVADAAPTAQEYTVGICQLMVHDSLDKATQGFVDALTAEMEAAGNTVKFDTQVAGDKPAAQLFIFCFFALRYIRSVH